MIKKGIIPLLAMGHGINDLLAGYWLGHLANGSNHLDQAALALLVYNLLAFGGQYPIALWLEKISNRKAVLAGAFFLNIMATFLFPLTTAPAVVCAGLASAIYHVAGGTVCASENKALPIGLFAAPGVAGLIAGGYLAWAGYSISLLLIGICIGFFLLLLLCPIPAARVSTEQEEGRGGSLDTHDLLMILLLTVIALRSGIWNIFQLIHEKEYDWLLAIGAAAFLGKIAGGWLSDRIGWRPYTYLSLFAATPLISFYKDERILFCIGIGILQSGIPATTALLIQSANGKKERGIGLSFGMAIIIGAFVFALPVRLFHHLWMIVPAMVILITLIFYWTGRPSYARRGSGIVRNGK